LAEAAVNAAVKAPLVPGAYRRGWPLALDVATQNGHTREFEAFARSDDVESL